MQLYKNTLRRYWWLFLLIFLINIAAQIVNMRPNSSYTARASLWAEQSIYTLDNPYQPLDGTATAAKSHVNLLTSLMSTPTFLTNITDKLEVEGYKFITVVAADNFKVTINRDVKITEVGDALVQLEFSDPDERLASMVLQATLDSYQDFVLNLLKTQGNATISYMISQLDSLKKQVDEADAKVKEFVATNSLDKTDDPLGTIPFISPEDFSYSILQQNQTDLKKQYDNLTEQLKQFQVNFASLVDGKSTLFMVKDKPNTISSLTFTPTSRLLLGIGVGLFGAILFGIFGVLMITWFDSSLQSPGKAKLLMEVSFIATVPWHSAVTYPKERNKPNRGKWTNKV